MSKMVLVIDDEEDSNQLICEILKSAGYEALGVTDGLESIEKAVQTAPEIILLDIMMPRISGIDVCRELQNRRETKDIPIIMITAKIDLSSKIASFVAGARRYITKPFDFDDVIYQVNALLKQHKQMNTIGDRFLKNEQERKSYGY